MKYGSLPKMLLNDFPKMSKMQEFPHKARISADADMVKVHLPIQFALR